jgi:hypothetical protein
MTTRTVESWKELLPLIRDAVDGLNKRGILKASIERAYSDVSINISISRPNNVKRPAACDGRSGKSTLEKILSKQPSTKESWLEMWVLQVNGYERSPSVTLSGSYNDIDGGYDIHEDDLEMDFRGYANGKNYPEFASLVLDFLESAKAREVSREVIEQSRVRVDAKFADREHGKDFDIEIR